MIAGCRTSTVPYGVTKIDAGVFKNCRGLRYLSIPETVTEIGYGALYRCSDLTTLIIPGENDSDEEMREICGFIKKLETENKKNIPLHITRFFPRFHMTDRDATDVMRLRELAKIAREQLKIVYLGNC